MTKLFRRIVVGMDKAGNGYIESDEKPPVTFALEDQYPGYNNIEIWETSNIPPSYDEVFKRDNEYDFNIKPGRVRLCTMRLPPINELIEHQTKLGNKVDLKTFGMHRTDTIDCLTLLSGEITLILENGDERTLEPGDSVIMKGAPHAWQNRGKDACYAICTMIGANPLE